MHITVGKSLADKTLLKKLGISQEDIGLIQKSFMFGDSRIRSGETAFKKLNYDELKKIMLTQPKTSSQKEMIDFARENTGLYITKLEGNLTSAVADLYKQSQMKIISDTIVDGIGSVSSTSEVVTKLRDRTEDCKRDWHRVAQTEMWNAKLQGEANAILKGSSPLTDKGAETLVYKRPAPDACPHCIKLYLEPGTLKPRVFKLSELMKNGTNYGLKTADWKACLGTLHPNCACTLNVMPPGFKFDDNGDLVPED